MAGGYFVLCWHDFCTNQSHRGKPPHVLWNGWHAIATGKHKHSLHSQKCGKVEKMPTVRFNLCVTREEGRNMLVGRVGQLGCRFLKSGWLVPDIKAPCELPEPPQALSLTAAAREPQSCPVRGLQPPAALSCPTGSCCPRRFSPLGHAPPVPSTSAASPPSWGSPPHLCRKLIFRLDWWGTREGRVQEMIN